VALNRKYGESALNTIHSSLNVEDRVAALIRKQKLLTYPEGSDLAGNIVLSILNLAYADYISQGFCENTDLIVFATVTSNGFAKSTTSTTIIT
jgi:hypothetical protein